MAYTNTFYLLLSCNYQTHPCLGYLFVIARFIFPWLFGAGLVWSPEMVHISNYYVLYYILGFVYGLLVIGSLPCEALISD